MSVNQYDIESHLAELYDVNETQLADVHLIRRLVGDTSPLRIFEPFCGTGRVLIPLAKDGHEVVGVDISESMLERARARIGKLDVAAQQRITLHQADVTTMTWPSGFDVVLLGGNCFYELASPEQQEGCVASAWAALKVGGRVYVDNDHMEGEIHESWLTPGKRKTIYPAGVCVDGARAEGTTEALWHDLEKRLWRARRTITVIFPDGRRRTKEWVHQKHPVSFDEVKSWLERHGFVIEQSLGDRAGSPYTPESPRAIFWARKQRTG
jgi:SAM-dependent methyltransferase